MSPEEGQEEGVGQQRSLPQEVLQHWVTVVRKRVLGQSLLLFQVVLCFSPASAAACLQQHS